MRLVGLIVHFFLVNRTRSPRNGGRSLDARRAGLHDVVIVVVAGGLVGGGLVVGGGGTFDPALSGGGAGSRIREAGRVAAPP